MDYLRHCGLLICYKGYSNLFTGTVVGKSQGEVVKGRRVGHWVSNNPVTTCKGIYKNNRRDGPWVCFNNHDGLLSSLRNYKDGSYHGPSVSYWNGEKVASRGAFKDGKKDGPWVYYYPNGQLQTKGTFKNGKRHGNWVEYNQDGTLDKGHTGTFKGGVKVSD